MVEPANPLRTLVAFPVRKRRRGYESASEGVFLCLGSRYRAYPPRGLRMAHNASQAYFYIQPFAAYAIMDLFKRTEQLLGVTRQYVL